MNPGPVGVFDSGVGGLSVLRAIRRLLPCEALAYVADSGHAPYGDKPRAYIENRSLELTRFLCSQGAKAVVVACNTATAAAAESLRARFDVPIVGMEPAVKPATEVTRTGVVGVMATVGTLSSARFAALLQRAAAGVRVTVQACPGLVERIEAGDLAGPETRRLVETYTAPLVSAGADVIVLGSTHYPFLRPLIREVVGPGVALIDTGDAVARRLQTVLADRRALAADPSRGSEDFWTTGEVSRAGRVMSLLWGCPVAVRPLPT